MLDLLSSKGIAPPEETSAPPPKQLQRRPAQQIAPPKSQLPEDLRPLEALAQKRKDELSAGAAEALTRELTRLAKIPAQAAEYGVGKTYCEWLLSLPWHRVTEGKRLELDAARKMLDEDHEGLQEVKRRVIEYLAVYRLKRDLWEEKQAREQKERDEDTSGQLASGAQTPATSKEIVPYDPEKAAKAMKNSKAKAKPASEPAALPEPMFMVDDAPPDNVFRDKAPILLLVGPPGVGKTSIARSIAQSLGRKFHRISLGGVRDEAEIRGHRRTYVGALPGLFVQGLRKVGVSNPVILREFLRPFHRTDTSRRARQGRPVQLPRRPIRRAA
jgi:ATP-dependent Lon protease